MLWLPNFFTKEFYKGIPEKWPFYKGITGNDHFTKKLQENDQFTKDLQKNGHFMVIFLQFLFKTVPL